MRFVNSTLSCECDNVELTKCRGSVVDKWTQVCHAGETHEAIRHKAPTWGGWVLNTNTLSCCVCRHFANFKSVHSEWKCQIETETNLVVHIFRILLKSGQNRRSTLLKTLKLGKESEKEEKHCTDSTPVANLQPFYFLVWAIHLSG